MGSASRRIRRNANKLRTNAVSDLVSKMTKPDEECDKCTECMDDPECYMTCKKLYARNKERYKTELENFRNITGDKRI